MPRWVRFPAMLAVLTLVATGCLRDWTQFGYSSANARSTADDGLSATSLPTLAPWFVGHTGAAVYSSPAVASGVAYITSDDGKLYAFSATGTTGCSGAAVTCQPLWTATIEPSGAIGASGTVSSSPAVSGGVVYVGSTSGTLQAFDAAGSNHCSGTPTVCTPLWTAATGGSILSSPVVSGSAVYVGSTDGKLYAFDSAGVTNCSGTTCSPLWTGTTGGAIDDSPAVSGGVAYVGSADGRLYAFDSAGANGCSGSPTVCAPLWTGATGAPITFSSPSVGGGSVFVGSTSGVLSAFDAAGSTGCSGAPKTCSPEWTMTTGGSIVSSPAVTSTTVYVGSSDHRLYAVDATGATGCTGSPKTCTALWTATTGGAVRSSPTVGGGMVFVGSDDHHVDAFDATGTTDCSGAPKACTPLWTTATGAAVSSSPVVAQGAVYVASADDTLYAYRPWTFTRPNCPTNPHAGLGPCQLQDAYRLPSQVTGAGRTVAIVDAYDNPNAESDLAVYRAAYGLPPCTTANGCFKKLNQSGTAGSYPAADKGWSEEISLDLDAVSAICPLCNITLLEANSPAFTDLAATEDAAAAQGPVAISNSFDGAEFSNEHLYDTHFTHPGIAITVATGDAGYGVGWPSSAPSVTAVGGTTLTADTSTRGWTETAWSGAGSGCSSQEAKPAWQTDASCSMRTTADVSALAGTPGASVYDTYGGDPGWMAFDGTSLATPIIAAVYALAYPIVPMATTYARTASLFDITSGSNGSCGGSYLCTAAVGFDGPTGLGTPCGTAAFGSGPFTTGVCPGSSAAPALQDPATTPGPVAAPACGPVPAGYARCLAGRIH